MVDDKNKIKLVIHSNTQKLESTKIIQMYNEVREYRNSINKEYNLDCSIEKYTNNTNITIKYDDCCINAKNYTELNEKVKKIEELKNQILSFGKEFNFNCSYYDIIRICNKIDKITIIMLDNINLIVIYNNVREYKNSINKEFNLDCCIETCYNNDLISNITLKYNNVNINSKNYIKLTEKVKKIEEIRNQILSVDKNFNIRVNNNCEEIDYICFYNNINNIGINNVKNSNIVSFIEIYNQVIEYKINDDYAFYIHYNYNDDDDNNIYIKINIEYVDEAEDVAYIISIDTKTTSTFEIYNQLREYIDSISKVFNFDCNIDMTYKDNIIVITDNGNIELTVSNNNNIKSIIEIYKEVNEYLNSINKEFGYNISSCSNVKVCYGNDNIIKEIETCNICANNYIEFTEKLEEKKRLEKEEKRRLEDEKIRLENEKMAIELSKELSKILKEDVIIKEIDNNSFVILIQYANTKYKIKITYYNIGNIPNIPNTFSNIPDIYTEVKNYKNKIINLKPDANCYIETHYTLINNPNNTKYISNLINKITLKCDDYDFSVKSYYECDKKILEHVKMNEEHETIKLKLKYGDKTDLTITYKEFSKSYTIKEHDITFDLVIYNVDIEYIDLLDFIPTYPANIIINGFIKNINNVNYDNIKFKLGCKVNWIPKHILNITIQNCPNLKIINNIIHCENNCNLKIVNCPKIEFIQNYNNFTEIYMNNCLVKVFNE